jgi:hypothetical protein
MNNSFSSIFLLFQFSQILFRLGHFNGETNTDERRPEEAFLLGVKCPGGNPEDSFFFLEISVANSIQITNLKLQK